MPIQTRGSYYVTTLKIVLFGFFFCFGNLVYSWPENVNTEDLIVKRYLQTTELNLDRRPMIMLNESETEQIDKNMKGEQLSEKYNATNSQMLETFLYMPDDWRENCNTQNGDVFTDQSNLHVNITCEIGRNKSVDFLTFRNFTSKIKQNVLFSLIVNCNGGAIYLPKYARARLLYSLKVVGCIIYGYDNEVTNFDVDRIPDDMKNYALIDCQTLLTQEVVIQSLQTERYSNTYECGPLNSTSIIERNMSINVEEINIEDAFHFGAKLHRQQHKNSIKCVYKNLEYYEKSNTKSISTQTLLNLLQDGVYPNLQVFNFSSCGIMRIPPPLTDWRFLYKNLEYVDLRNNLITEIGVIRDHGNDNENPNSGTIDLRFNNISILTMRHISPLLNYTLLTVDIRDNPFNCICEMNDFIKFIKTNFTMLPKQYKYLSELTCHEPFDLRGKLISQLSLEDIGCEILKTSISKIPVVLLSSFIIVFSVSTILSIRYRKEIIILTYTRLNILLPCQQRKTYTEKTFDAFIAYSEADTSWVVHTLSKRLENTDNVQPFKLCLHHRDFIVGAAIADNIIQSVENSRHTVIIVSKHFLKSEWCRLEFRTALHQSLLEKKRHLIIVLLEDIPPSEFEPELKRCMQTLTYVKADDRWFWDKLVYALSDWSKKPKQKSKTLKRDRSLEKIDNHGEEKIVQTKVIKLKQISTDRLDI